MRSIKSWIQPEADRLAKLPVWAKQYIDLLERTVGEQETLVDRLSGDPVEYGDRDEAKVYASIPGDDLWRELPLSSRIKFPTTGGAVEVCVDRGGVRVMGTGVGGPLHIIPQVSNVVNIEVGKR